MLHIFKAFQVKRQNPRKLLYSHSTKLKKACRKFIVFETLSNVIKSTSIVGHSDENLHVVARSYSVSFVLCQAQN